MDLPDNPFFKYLVYSFSAKMALNAINKASHCCHLVGKT